MVPQRLAAVSVLTIVTVDLLVGDGSCCYNSQLALVERSLPKLSIEHT